MKKINPEDVIVHIHGIRPPEDVIKRAQELAASMGVDEVHVGDPGSAVEFLNKNGGTPIETLLVDKATGEIVADMGAFDLSIPYNGVEGDSCGCPACNERRSLFGPSPGEDDHKNAEGLKISRGEPGDAAGRPLPPGADISEAMKRLGFTAPATQEGPKRDDTVHEVNFGGGSTDAIESLKALKVFFSEREENIARCMRDVMAILDKVIEAEEKIKKNPNSSMVPLIRLMQVKGMEKIDEAIEFLGIKSEKVEKN